MSKCKHKDVTSGPIEHNCSPRVQIITCKKCKMIMPVYYYMTPETGKYDHRVPSEWRLSN